MRVVGYVRVSTEDQAREGVSLDAQREKVRLYAGLHALDLIEVVSDPGFSAKSLDRPGLSRVLALLDSGDAAGVVVFKLDRLTRSLVDWARLIDLYFGERGGRSLMSVSESIDTRTAAGRMVLNIMMTVLQWERETIVERTRAAVKFKQGKGERVSGRIPYGWRLRGDGKTLDPVPGEVAIVRDIHEHRAAGRSLRWIAAELQRRGIATRGGGPWSPDSVRGILSRPAPDTGPKP